MAKNEAKIKFTAETGEFNNAIKQANAEMGELRAELKLNDAQMKRTGTTVEGLEKKHSLLEAQLKSSSNKTEALSEKVKKAVEIFGENSTEAIKLKTQLATAQTAEENLRAAVDRCTEELEEQKKGFDSAGDSAKGASDGFTVAKGVIADLASNAIQFAIGKVSEFVGWLAELPEATRELRQDMATLETSFESAGLSTEQATDTWKELYTVFGEDDRAVEAANLIAKMSDNQKDLSDWVTITTGIWGTYQDSLPVEGLAEASNETAKTGKVTGVLADALNWSSEAATMFAEYMSEDVVTAEDAFNEALKECTTEEERQALITETLTALYGDAATEYEKASGAQLDAKEAAAENTLAQAELASAIEPVTTAWTGLKTELITAVTPAIEKVSGGMVKAMGWLREHPVVLKAVAAAVGVLAVGLGVLATAWGVYTVAQWAANSAMLANPITWIIVGVIAAVAALVAIIVVVVEYWDEIVTACRKAWESVKATLSQWGGWINTNVIQPVVNFFVGLWDSIVSGVQSAWDWCVNALSSVATWVNTNVIQPVINFFEGLWQGVKNVWNTICNVIQFSVLLIGSIISAAVNIITLPFRFIWENCKEYVFAAWEWIKSKVTAGVNKVKSVITSVMNAVKSVFSTIWNGIKTFISTIWNGIKSVVTAAANAVKSRVTTVWNAVKSITTTVFNAVKSKVSAVWNSIKSVTSSVFNAVKSTVTNVWNGIKNTVSNAANSVKSKVSSVWNGVKSTTSSVFNSVKSTATSVWNGIKSAITKPIEEAKNKVKAVVDAIKGFFNNMKLKFPNIKMPHFSVKGKFSLDPPSVPKLSISWYKDGGIFVKPTIFNTPYGLKGVGEAGAEAVLPIDRLEGYIAGAIARAQNVTNLDPLIDAIEELASRDIHFGINGRELALATASDNDRVIGRRSALKSRGLALE